MKLDERIFEFEDSESKHLLRIEDGFNHGEFKVEIPESQRVQTRSVFHFGNPFSG